jgi:hypothetical protein
MLSGDSAHNSFVTAVSTYLLFLSERGGQRTSKRPDPWTPELDLIWRPFLESEHPLLISLGTPMFTKFQGMFFRDPKMNDWSDAENSDEVRLLKRDFHSDHAVPAYPYTGVGEATGAFLLCRLLQQRKSSMSVKRGNVLTWDDIRENDLIFVGPPKFNRHLVDLPTGDGFVMETGAIRNLRPRSGEQEVYRNSWTADHMELLEDYALIYALPGLHDHGRLLVLASGSSEATWAPPVRDPTRYARQLVSQVREPSGRIPRGYQVVVTFDSNHEYPRSLRHPSDSG